jgi:hypothetical protein
MVATVIEKMLSTALYWKIDRLGMAAAKTKTPLIIESPSSRVEM